MAKVFVAGANTPFLSQCTDDLQWPQCWYVCSTFSICCRSSGTEQCKSLRTRADMALAAANKTFAIDQALLRGPVESVNPALARFLSSARCDAESPVVPATEPDLASSQRRRHWQATTFCQFVTEAAMDMWIVEAMNDHDVLVRPAPRNDRPDFTTVTIWNLEPIPLTYKVSWC